MRPCGCTVARCTICNGVGAYRGNPPSLLLVLGLSLLAATIASGMFEGAERDFSAASAEVGE